MAANLLAAGAAKGLAENKNAPIVVGALIIGVVALGYFGIYRPIIRPRLCKTGILTCETKDQKLDRKIARFDGFNPKYFDRFRLTISDATAKVIRNNIKSALSGAGTNEEELYSALLQAGTKHNLSLVSHYYAAAYGKSLADAINDDTNYTEKKRVWDILKEFS